jgi:signal transduction histidine kinase
VVRELAAPIQRDGLIVAILGVGNKAQAYTEKDTDIVAYFADVAWEIARRKRAEEALHRQNEYLTALQETALDLISQFDLDELLENIVKRAGQLLGTASGFLDLVDPATGQLNPRVGLGTLTESLQHSVQPGEGVAGVVWQTGQPVVIDHYDTWTDRIGSFSLNTLHAVIGVPLLSGSRVQGVLGLAYDSDTNRVFGPEAVEILTQFARLATVAIENARLFAVAQQELAERKQAEAEIQKLNAELEQRVHDRTVQLETTNQELEAFAYSVSHDLRAPLRGIDGWSHALLEDYTDRLDDQGRQYLDRIRAETQRMGHLIDDLLKLSRVTRAEMRQERVNLSALAQTIVTRLQESEPERQVEFSLQPGLAAVGDPDLLEAALANLLDNAFKFTGRRAVARIEFGQIETPDQRTFFVRDNGAGFDMAYSQKLFGAFQRMHRTSDFPGTGIGLATAQRIIHRHGGRVWAKAAVDQGATFYFTLEEAT